MKLSGEPAEARAEIERLTVELEQMTAIKDIHQNKRAEYFERSKKAEAERGVDAVGVARGQHPVAHAGEVRQGAPCLRT